MKIYVDEMPKSCAECPMCRSGNLKINKNGRYVEAEQCVFGQYKYQTFDDEIDTCPLLSLVDHDTELLKNAIVVKFQVGNKYYAVCKLTKSIQCPVCNGRYRKIINEDGFKGEIECSNCDCGKVKDFKWDIIPTTLKSAKYEDDGTLYRSELDLDYKFEEGFSFDYDNQSGIYYNTDGDYRSDWYYEINNQNMVFATLTEAEAKIKELRGGNR